MEHDVFGLDVPVRYADAVGRGERAGDLNRDLDRVIQFQALFQPLAQRLPLDELHRHKMCDAGLGLDLPDLVNGQNVRMAGGAGGAGLLLEAPDALRVRGELRRQQFERDDDPRFKSSAR